MRSPAALLRRRDRGAGSPAGARRFAAGERSTADLIAPTAMEETRGHLAIDGQLTRVLALTGYPRHVSPNWLGRLIDQGEPLDLSLHLEPLDSGDAVRGLTHRLVELQSSRLLDAKGGRITSAEREVAYEDAERLRDALERGDERVFSGALYLRMHGRSAAELDRAAARVEGTLGGMMATARPALYEMLPGLLSCLPAGQDHLGRRRNLDTSSVATMIPFTSSALATRRGLLYGESVHNSSLVIFDPFGADQENANKVVFAKSGAGKSYACKVEALRALLLGVEYYVIDPEDEYGRICEAVGGQMVRLSGGSPVRINPFDLPPGGPEPDRADPDARDPLAERVLALQGLLALMLAAPGESLGPAEQGVLDRALYESYRRAGITTDPATHDRPAPVLRDLVEVLQGAGEPHGLAERLERYVSGSLGRVFSERTTAELDRPFVVFNVEGLEEELRPLATYLIADHIWGRVKRDPKPRVLLRGVATGLVVVHHEHEGRIAWIRADASGVLVRGAEARPFLLEYDRGTLDSGDYRAKFEGYRRYYAAGEWEDHFPREPALLFVCSDHRAEARVGRAVNEWTGRARVFVAAEWRIEPRGGTSVARLLASGGRSGEGGNDLDDQRSSLKRGRLRRRSGDTQLPGLAPRARPLTGGDR